MGLDMHLTKETYVADSRLNPADKKFEVTVKLGNEVYKSIKPERITHITEEVAYWRKANAIHKWFVENVQDGVDNCRSYPVGADKLKELVDLCKQVLNTVETIDGQINTGTTYHGDGRVEETMVDGQVIAQPAIAEQLLPTTSGFFFGGTEYDEYYLEDLRLTVEQLEPLLEECRSHSSTDDVNFYYRSSW